MQSTTLNDKRIVQRANNSYMTAGKVNASAVPAPAGDLAVETRLASIETGIQNTVQFFYQEMNEIKEILAKILDNNSKANDKALLKEFNELTDQVPEFKKIVSDQAEKVWSQVVKSEFNELVTLRYVS